MPEQHVLEHVRIRLIAPDDASERERYRELIENHHYLKSDTLVGEQLRYMAEVDGHWLALLSWSAAANHLKDRDGHRGFAVRRIQRKSPQDFPRWFRPRLLSIDRADN